MCLNYESDGSKWELKNVKEMDSTFYNCQNFKGNGIYKWNISNVNNYYRIFEHCNFDKSVWFKKKFQQYPYNKKLLGNYLNEKLYES
jgi:hypothetical protein